MIFTFNDKAFGKNDIRGIVGDSVTPELFYFIGKAYSKYICDRMEKKRSETWVSVAMDARNHSPELTKALIRGVTSNAVNVLDMGLCPTPLGYYSEFAKLVDAEGDEIPEISGSLIVTASHNPSEYNGLKMTFNKASFNEQQIDEVKEITRDEMSKPLQSPIKTGVSKKFDIIPTYIESMVNSFSKVGKGLKIVVDSANATAGVVAPKLYRDLGCEVIELYSEPDGDFPNHHPNPSDEKTLDDLKAKVLETKADFGIAFDGDSDRVGIVDNKGYSIPGDQLLLIFALNILEDLKGRNEKPVFISEVKCSQVLYDTINANGGNAIMWKTGHGYIKSKMKEENALMAGEMSGHIFFRDRFYGFDDAFYAGCRFIEIMGKKRLSSPKMNVSDIIAELPQACTSREVRFPCANELKKPVLKALREFIDANADIFGSEIKEINTLDGMRIIFDGGFALIRQSNTEPVFTLRFEAKTEEKMENYKKVMVENLDKIVKELSNEIE